MGYKRIVTPREDAVARLQLSDLVSPRAHAYVTYSDVTGTSVAVGDVVHLISRYNFHALLKRITFMNAVLLKAGLVHPKQQANMITNLLDDPLRAQLNASDWGRRTSYITVFHRQQQLFLLRLALLACPLQGGEDWGDDARYVFGKVCLMVNDLLDRAVEPTILPEKLAQDTPDIQKALKELQAHTGVQLAVQPSADSDQDGQLLVVRRTQTTLADYLDLFAKLVPTVELNVDRELKPNIARARWLWVHSQAEERLQKERDHVDFNRAFTNKYGVGIDDLITSLLAILALRMQFNPHAPDCMDSLKVDTRVFLSNSKLPPDVLQKCLRAISITPLELGRRLLHDASQSAVWDFTLMRRYPLLEVEPGQYVGFDECFLLKVVSEGIYWLLDECLTGKDKNNFKPFFGKVFAAYVDRIFRRIYGSAHLLLPRYLSGLRFEKSGDDEVCDGFLEFDKVLVLMEYKGSLLQTRAKYTGDVAALQGDLDSKFVGSFGSDNKNKRKGVAQLAHSIKRLFNGDRVALPGFDFKRYELVLPVIVSYDVTLGTPVAGLYLDHRFSTELKKVEKVGPRVGRLTVMTTRDVECLESISRRQSLLDVLRRYQDDAAATTPFWDFLYNRYRQDLGEPGTLVEETVQEVFDIVGSRLFGATLMQKVQDSDNGGSPPTR
jgi:hypothetical protein